MARNNNNDNEHLTSKKLHGLTHNESGQCNSVVFYIKLADDRVNYVSACSYDNGNFVLTKICTMLGILYEKDYFGLTFDYKGEKIWINLKNRLSKQIPGTSPYNLSLAVKYFIDPSDIIMEQTKHQFFLDIVRNLKIGSWGPITDEDLFAKLIALQTHVQFGPYNNTTTACKYAIFIPSSLKEEISSSFIRRTAQHHKRLEGVTKERARYDLLQLVHENVEFYGCHVYPVKNSFDKPMKVSVGPKSLFICNESGRIVSKHDYSSVSTITLATKVVKINILEDDNTTKPKLFQLSSAKLAHSLYRCVTEVHAFFMGDTIPEELLNQSANNIRETLSFLFDSSTSREYAFDVSLTAREVLDKTRRYLHQAEMATKSTDERGTVNNYTTYLLKSNSNEQLGLARHLQSVQHHCSSSMMDSLDSCHTQNRQRNDSERSGSLTIAEDELNEIIQFRLKQAHLCQICCDVDITRIFLPCGHAICCEKCANCLEQCPLCRASINMRHPVFLPKITDDHLELNRHSTNLMSEGVTNAISQTHRLNSKTLELSSQNSSTMTDETTGER